MRAHACIKRLCTHSPVWARFKKRFWENDLQVQAVSVHYTQALNSANVLIAKILANEAQSAPFCQPSPILSAHAGRAFYDVVGRAKVSSHNNWPWRRKHFLCLFLVSLQLPFYLRSLFALLNNLSVKHRMSKFKKKVICNIFRALLKQKRQPTPSSFYLAQSRSKYCQKWSIHLIY